MTGSLCDRRPRHTNDFKNGTMLFWRSALKIEIGLVSPCHYDGGIAVRGAGGGGGWWGGGKGGGGGGKRGREEGYFIEKTCL